MIIWLPLNAGDRGLRDAHAGLVTPTQFTRLATYG